MKRLTVRLICLSWALALTLPAGARPDPAGDPPGRAGAGMKSGGSDGNRGRWVAAYVRGVLGSTGDPEAVAALLSRQGIRFLGRQAVTVSFVLLPGGGVAPAAVRTTTAGPDLGARTTEERLGPEQGVGVAAGRKGDFRLTQWLYEWRNPDGTYTQQSVTTGHWSDPEWRWMDNPDDVIDVRWVVGDLVYVAAYPGAGVRHDQHTQGAASFTVDDQVKDWDLIVNFTPSSPAVYGKYTNVFTNYTHTWRGWRLHITLSAGPAGSTGSVSIDTDARTWTKGTGLPIRIAAEETRGPATTGPDSPGMQVTRV